jgi:hypothetical protein
MQKERAVRRHSNQTHQRETTSIKMSKVEPFTIKNCTRQNGLVCTDPHFVPVRPSPCDHTCPPALLMPLRTNTPFLSHISSLGLKPSGRYTSPKRCICPRSNQNRAGALGSNQNRAGIHSTLIWAFNLTHDVVYHMGKKRKNWERRKNNRVKERMHCLIL